MYGNLKAFECMVILKLYVKPNGIKSRFFKGVSEIILTQLLGNSETNSTPNE